LGPQAVPRLIEALKHEKFRPEVIYTLGRIGPAASPATDALSKFVDDKNSRVAQEAIITLGKIGPAAKAAVPALVKALSEKEDKDMNFASIEYALGKIGPDAISAEPVLVEKLNDKNDNVRFLSAWALAQIHGSSADVAAKAVPVLITGLAMADMTDKVISAEALGKFGSLAKSSEDALKKAASDPDKNLAEAATAALAQVEKAPEAGTVKTAPPAPAVAAITYKPGEHAVTVEDKVEVGMGGSQGQIVPKGTKLKVLEIRGSWIGVQAEIDGKTYKGWVLSEQIGKL
jgi:HEAT repeat protein